MEIEKNKPVDLQQRAKETIERLKTTPRGNVDYTQNRVKERLLGGAEKIHEDVPDIDLRRKANELKRSVYKDDPTKTVWDIVVELRAKRASEQKS